MKELDKTSIDDYGIPGIVLMENAGIAVVRLIEEILGGVKGRRVTVVCGTGNNGGDGFVVARHLFNKGARVKVLLIGDPASLRGDSAINYNCAQNIGVDIVSVGQNDTRRVKFALSISEVVVDAVFGIGFHGKLQSPHDEILPLISQSERTVVAVDTPSGLSDSGELASGGVRADFTVTFGLPKLGQLIYPGANSVGKLIVADIGFPSALLRESGDFQLITSGMVRGNIPKRPATAHKGTAGIVLGVAGSRGMVGAASLAATAALRTGAGLVKVAAPSGIIPSLAEKLTEATTLSLPEKDGCIDALGVSVLTETKCDALFVGPGMGTGQGVAQVVNHLLLSTRQPAVFDADALNIIAAFDRSKKPQPGRTVMTPHPGEMARLLGTETSTIEANRIKAVRQAARLWNTVMVLKGARTLVASSDGPIYINPTGNPGMASGGMGDALTGIIGAFLAGGMNPLQAAISGVFIHGSAGDLAAKEVGMHGLIASDLIRYIPKAITEVLRSEEDWSEEIPNRQWNTEHE